MTRHLNFVPIGNDNAADCVLAKWLHDGDQFFGQFVANEDGPHHITRFAFKEPLEIDEQQIYIRLLLTRLFDDVKYTTCQVGMLDAGYSMYIIVDSKLLTVFKKDMPHHFCGVL